MKQQNWWETVFGYFAYFTQFGMMMVTPPVLYTMIGFYLHQKWQIGVWVVFVGLALGLATAFYQLYRFMHFVQKKSKESEQEKV